MSHGYELGLTSITTIAAADLSDYQYRAVKLNSDEEVNLASEGEKMSGILQDAPDAADKACIVAYDGISKAVAGGEIDAGDDVEVGTDGKLIKATSGEVIGEAFSPAGADGEIFAVRLKC